MADADSSLTPEQRLLKLIENPKAAADITFSPTGVAAVKKPPQAGKKGKPNALSFDLAAIFSPCAIQGRIEYVKDWLLKFAKGEIENVGLQTVNRLLQWAVIAYGSYLAIAIFYEVFLVYKDYGAEFRVEPKEMAEVAMSEGKQVDPNLFDEVERRNIFIAQDKRPAPELIQNQEMSLRLVELTKDMKLTGISMNEKDPARTFCMIEDLKKNVTNFLKVGDTVSGLRVDQISPDGVVLKYQKESIELR